MLKQKFVLITLINSTQVVIRLKGSLYQKSDIDYLQWDLHTHTTIYQSRHINALL